MNRIITTILITFLFLLPIAALAESGVTVYGTHTDILQHINKDFVVVGVKVNVGNDGPPVKVYATVKALDINGYEIASVRMNGTIRESDTATLTGNTRMNKLKYLESQKWEVSDLVTYPIR